MTPDLVALSAVTAKKMGEKNLAILKQLSGEASQLECELWAQNEASMVKEMTDKGWVKFNDGKDISPFVNSVKGFWGEYEARFHNGLVQAVLKNR